MATIASRPQVVQMEPQFRPLGNRYLMVGMQVALAASECSAQFIQHLLRWWLAKSDFPAHSDDIRFPSTVHTPPVVALETENPQPTVMRVVAAFASRTAAHVVVTLLRPAVSLAGSTLGEFGAARNRARTQDAPDSVCDAHVATSSFVRRGRYWSQGWLLSWLTDFTHFTDFPPYLPPYL